MRRISGGSLGCGGRRPGSIAAAACVVWVAFAAAGCGVLDPFNTTFEDEQEARTYEADRVLEVGAPEGTVRVATWNIKFGGARIEFFWECPGERVNMERSEVVENLRPIAAAMNRIDADVSMLQEVDVASKRAAYVDQVEWLLEHTQYNYAAYASQWKSDYVPSDGIGKIDSGNAVLSVWPIEEATRYKLPLIEEQGGLTQYFYLRRNILDARITVPGRRDLRVLATHTAAFAEDDTTRRQIEQLAERARQHDDAGRLVVAGGDLNTIPPGTTKEKDFWKNPPEECDDAGSDYTDHDGWMDPMYGSFEPAVSLSDYRSSNRPHFTFTGQANGFWNRKLDYLFTNGAFAAGATVTYQSRKRGGIETMPLSDHAPVAADVRLSSAP